MKVTLGKLQPEFIMAGHCAGFAMMAELHKRFGSRFTPAFVGANIEC